MRIKFLVLYKIKNHILYSSINKFFVILFLLLFRLILSDFYLGRPFVFISWDAAEINDFFTLLLLSEIN